MRLQTIRIQQLRNLQPTVWMPHPKLNLIFGQNGQGKTSLLEGIKLISDLRSFRTAQLEDLIQTGCDWASVAIEGESDHGVRANAAFRFQVRPRAGRSVEWNSKSVPSGSEYLRRKLAFPGGAFYVYSFDPSEHEMVRGSPSLRRSYFSQSASALDPDLIPLLKRYQRSLEQRNELLKQLAPDRLVEPFTTGLIEMGAQILERKERWVALVNTLLPTYQQKIAPRAAPVRVISTSSWFENVDKPQGDLWISHLQAAAIRLRGEERGRKQTLFGPHRDSWEFEDASIGVYRGKASQGEVRTALLSLKMAEMDLFKEKHGSLPIFLIDDLSSELDSARRGFLLDFLDKTDLQVFVSTTELIPLKGGHFEVKQGYLLEHS